MQQLTFQEFDALWPEVEAAVDNTPEIDRWCSGPDWLVSVATGFAPDVERLLFATPDLDGFALLARYRDTDPAILGGLEPLWGFGTPILGADPAEVARQLVPHLAERDDWRGLLLTGMPTEIEPTASGLLERPNGRHPKEERHEQDHDSEAPRIALPPRGGVAMAMALALSPLGSVHFGPGITRQVADLSKGYDAWLDRRTARFRRNLRQAGAKADACGVTFQDASADPDLFDRLMAVEHRTWKGREGSGITSVQMSTMYRIMIDRLQRRGRLLAHVAGAGGHDVGYILGGVRAGRYRGLQLSYDESARHLSVGNLLQVRQLRQLEAEGLATTYDLGMDFGYKRRWADRAETSLNMFIRRDL